MLFYKFRNFEEFNELFGIQHHGNGEKSRKNKILLSYIKDRKLLHDAITSGDFHLLHISSMAELKQTMIAEILRSGIRDDNLPYKVEILKTSIGVPITTRMTTKVSARTETIVPSAMSMPKTGVCSR